MITQLQQYNISDTSLNGLSLPDDYLINVHSAHKKFIKSMSYEQKSKRAGFSYREAEFLKFLFRAIERNNSGKIHNSMRWIYFTQKEIGEKLMCSEMSIYRITKSLVQKGIILKECLSNNILNRTLFYTLHPDVLKHAAFFMSSNPSKSKDVITAGGVVVNTTTPVVINQTQQNGLLKKIDGKLLVQYMYDKTREILSHTEKLTAKLAQYLAASYRHCFKYDVSAFLEYVHSLNNQSCNKMSIIQCFSFKQINAFYGKLKCVAQNVKKDMRSIKTSNRFVKAREILVKSENTMVQINVELNKIFGQYHEGVQSKARQLIGWFHKKYGDHEVVYAFKNAKIVIDDKKITFCFKTNFYKDFFLRKDRYLEFKQYVQRTYSDVFYIVESKEGYSSITNIENCNENDVIANQCVLRPPISNNLSGVSYECSNSVDNLLLSEDDHVCLVA